MIRKSIEYIFRDVNPGWKFIFLNHNEIRLALNKSLIELEKKIPNDKDVNDYILPPVENILEAFKYFSPEQLRIIIIGQDPYPNKEHAHGLSFSVPSGVSIPPSLKNIYKCLIERKQIQKFPESGNLVSWAKQGVLLLNRYLTRSIEKSDELHSFWSNFTDKLLYHLSRDLAEKYEYKYVAVFLWGEKAKELEKIISNRFEIFIWGHPSPMSALNRREGPHNFMNCHNFEMANLHLRRNKLQPINWDPENTISVKKIIAVYIGACINSKIGSYAVYFPPLYNGIPNIITMQIYGIVPPYRMELGNDIKKGLITKESYPITDNRAELVALIYSLWAIQDIKTEEIYLVTKSTYIQCLLEKKINNFNDKDLQEDRILNSDLIIIIKKILPQIKIKIIHPTNIEHKVGNEVIESLCNKVLNIKDKLNIYLPYII
ncbi:MAG: uracil-DNA glycosylase [Nitrososphaerota archaeon]